jgi:hypothetical protein
MARRRDLAGFRQMIWVTCPAGMAHHEHRLIVTLRETCQVFGI